MRRRFLEKRLVSLGYDAGQIIHKPVGCHLNFPGQSPGRLGFAKGTIERSPGRSARRSLASHSRIAFPHWSARRSLARKKNDPSCFCLLLSHFVGFHSKVYIVLSMTGRRFASLTMTGRAGISNDFPCRIINQLFQMVEGMGNFP